MVDDIPSYEQLQLEIEILKKQLIEKKDIEKELAKTRILMQAAFDQSPVPMVVVTYPNFTFKIINKAMEGFVLANAADYLNRTPRESPLTWKDCMPDGTPHPPGTELQLPMAMKGITTQNKESLIIRHDGTQVWGLASAAPIYDNDDQLIGAIYAATDITDRKKTEQILAENRALLKEQNEEYESLNEELREANEQLEKAKEKAEESDRLKTAFLQNISHEIRTPMNAIIGFTEFIENPDLSEEKRKNFTSIIRNSTHQLLAIVNDILTISALETNQVSIKLDKVCVNAIILELLAIFEPQASQQNISIYAQKPLTDEQSEIYTDKTKITQILTNLISNAFKFTHEGFIEFGYNISLETKHASSLTKLQFYVKDTGIGIDPSLHDKIFEHFHQADISVTKKYGGTGLGLAISKGFVDILGGEIWIESELKNNSEGKIGGTKVYFTIPYKPVKEINNSEISNQKHEIPKTILVAEDEEYNYLLIEELLLDLNIKLIHCKNGEETITVCESNTTIDLILMDIKMPQMDGFTAAKIIKEFRPELPIIGQSAYALEHEIQLYSTIFDDYITKPINADLLIQKISKYCEIGSKK